MISYKQVVKQITTEQIELIMKILGSAPSRKDAQGNLIFQSICHDSDSYKLYYFPDNKKFFCYREWKDFNIFSLAMQVQKVDFKEAFRFVCSTLGIDTSGFYLEEGFFPSYAKNDWAFFEKYLSDKITTEPDEVISERMLELYFPWYYEGWYKEHIAFEAMKKYGIRYDMSNNAIIIPHFNKDNELVGIRCRNLDVDSFAKYSPACIQKEWYSHQLAQNLYGLNFNRSSIERIHKVMLVESEKSVMQVESYFPENNFCVACCGSHISDKQLQLLLQMEGLREVILGFDFDYQEKFEQGKDGELVFSKRYIEFKKSLMQKAKKLIPYYTVYGLDDLSPRLLGDKCSPTDGGKEALLQIMQNKILITPEIIQSELSQE